MAGYIISFVIGLALGVPVNWLAFALPAWVLNAAAEGESTSNDSEVATTVSSDTTAHQTPTVFNFRTIASTLLLGTLVTYLYATIGFSAHMWILTFYMALFILVAIIDIEHHLILDVIMVPAFLIGVIEVLVSGRVSWVDGFSGYAIAQIIVMGFYVFGSVYLWWVNRGRSDDNKVDEVAFGFGDVTLATFCGLIVGFPGVILMLGLMVVIGGLNSILYVVITGLFMRNFKAHTALPYGPAILIAAVIMLLWGDVVARALGAN